CPICHNMTDVNSLKKQFKEKTTSERMLAVIWDGNRGKEYRLPLSKEIEILDSLPSEADRPQEPMPVKYTQALPSCTWGLEKWGQMFSDRQLLAMQTFVEELHEIKAQLGPT